MIRMVNEKGIGWIIFINIIGNLISHDDITKIKKNKIDEEKRICTKKKIKIEEEKRNLLCSDTL